MDTNQRQRPGTLTLLGMGVFLLIALWGLWHGVVGPRVIGPTYGDTSVTPPPPDPTRAPPTE